MEPDRVIKNCIRYALDTQTDLFKLEDVYKHFNLNSINLIRDEYDNNLNVVRQAWRLFSVSSNNFIKVQIKV
jgi:spore coat polysaccharide biosynthesis protein SpsF (cytidylyltransferase family)